MHNEQKIACRFDDGEAIAHRILAQQSDNAGRAETLPADAYNSDDFYRLEEQKVLREDWLFVGHLGQLPNENDYFTLDVVGEPLLIVRKGEGVRVMSNVCLHRWVPIVSGSGNASVFVCPFHNWSYDTEGRLTGAPSMQQAEGFVRQDCQLPQIRHEIIAGMIFVTFSATVESLSERFSELLPVLNKYHLATLQCAFTLDYDCPFNWKMAVETFIECYHHAGVHRTTLEDSFPGRLTWIGEDTPGWTVCHQPLRKRGELSEILTAGLVPFDGLEEDDLRRSDLYLLYPTCLMSLNPDRVTINVILPLNKSMSKWHRVVLVSKESAAREDFPATVEQMRNGVLTIVAEDLEINAAQQRGSRSQLARPGRLSHLETSVWHFANYLKRKLAV
ncbi:aromatic ring-hydroxylating dioxygenase subunit alpha [Erwinia endophytica]|uniref:aromatic ring-hydroxylating oxygenase subunit alpha n=1 Tax=Erwinia endophytica TaxID=1563158 RepID=UPI001265F6B3|nr:aromatic ring-hydroxylating dioxygenase subunit alpha [Erwinia endophytica]KAB8313799.1 aromatic ring-hydroxylating dioxygenase subunit alpha [Erwinia endophytica]